MIKAQQSKFPGEEGSIWMPQSKTLHTQSYPFQLQPSSFHPSNDRSHFYKLEIHISTLNRQKILNNSQKVYTHLHRHILQSRNDIHVAGSFPKLHSPIRTI